MLLFFNIWFILWMINTLCICLLFSTDLKDLKTFFHKLEMQFVQIQGIKLETDGWLM